jgi:hypothetical protein
VIIIYVCPWSVNAMMHEKLINNVAKELSKGPNQQRKQNSKPTVCPGSPTSNQRQTRNWINCKGTFIASSGNKIFGKWQRGLLQDKVIITTPKGIVAEGTYKDSKLIGKFKQVIKPKSRNELSKSNKVAKRTISKKKKSDKVFNRELERKIIVNTLSSGLEVKNICRVVPVWRIRKSSAYYKGYFFLPILPKSYFYIGGYGTQNDKKGRHCVKVVKPVGVKSSIDLLAPPRDWEMIWNSEGTRARKTGSFWNAIRPNDSYTCVGSVAQNGLEKPNMVLSDECELVSVWQ